MTAPHGTGHAPPRERAADEGGFDDLIHAPVRLRACAALDSVREIEFGALQSMLDISKSALSKHISALADAGYVTQRRAVRDTRQRVWLSLTPAGRSAYRGHVAALHRIVGRTDALRPAPRPLLTDDEPQNDPFCGSLSEERPGAGRGEAGLDGCPWFTRGAARPPLSSYRDAAPHPACGTACEI